MNNKIHLEIQTTDGILLTKKGLMKVTHLKELTVIKPLKKDSKNQNILRDYLKEKLTRELRSDLSNLGLPATSKSSSTSTDPSSDSSLSPQSSLPTTSTSLSAWEMPPLLKKWTDIVLDTMTKNPETVGRKMGKLDLPMQPAIFLGSHPLIHRTVLHRMVRFMREAYRDHKSEDILVMHRVPRPVPQSENDSRRYILRPRDVLLLLPTTLGQSSAHLRFELGTHFCSKCRITMTVNPREEVVCSCGNELQVLRCMGTIHSHGAMAAFSSGTDNKHEIPHIGFHMTVGNLDKAQESLVLSFCDGDVRIPLNISDLFATEHRDEAFNGQINNWLLVRREMMKRAAEEKKKASAAKSSSERRGSTRSRYHSNYPRSLTYERIREADLTDFVKPTNMELIEDDSLALTRPDPGEMPTLQGVMLKITQAEASGISTYWDKVSTMVRRISWTLSPQEHDKLLTRLLGIGKKLKPGMKGYHQVETCIDHLAYAADKVWEAP